MSPAYIVRDVCRGFFNYFDKNYPNILIDILSVSCDALNKKYDKNESSATGVTTLPTTFVQAENKQYRTELTQAHA